MAGNSFEMTLTNNTGNIITALDNEGQARLLAATVEWHGAVVRLLRGPRSGKIYPVPATNRTYQASAPGEPPAVRLGDLRQSYRFLIRDNQGLVGSPLFYAKDLEYGTHKTKPRPHLKRSYIQNRQQILAHFQGEWL